MSRFVFILVTALAMAASAAGQAGTWQIDPNHTAAQFSVRHLGVSTVRGAFSKVTGTVKHDSADPAKDSIDITFHSKNVKVAGPGKLQITGDLTIHGVTKEVVLDVDGPTEPIKDPMGKGQRMGASATTKVNRQDFGLGALSGAVGDEITITIDVEMTKA